MVVRISCSQPFPFWFLLLQSRDVQSSSASSVSSIDDYYEHKVWNSELEMLFLEQATGIFDSFLVDLDLAKIAFSCHSLDLFCYKEEVLVSAR